MKVLIIGGGGREHALADAFAKSTETIEIAVAPGNPGIGLSYNCIPLNSNAEILRWCIANNPDFVFVGPEKPLSEGLADILNEQGIPCIGPTQAAARIETSKIFAKELMQKYNIPTASYASFHDYENAILHIKSQSKYPIVIKEDGLAAGKGVAIVFSESEAIKAIREIQSKASQNSGVVVEEFLTGWEASLFVITDGNSFKSTIFAQDYKQLSDNDTGPNTGGMGAYCPVPEAEPYREEIEKTIIALILQAMRIEDCPYQGILYCGIMITATGPKVLEFNCRFGDPETQVLLPLLRTSMIDICTAIRSQQVNDLQLDWLDQSSVCVVLASPEYPESCVKGLPISIDANIASKVYFSGVSAIDGKLVTNGGRVLSLVALGDSKEAARMMVYHDLAAVDFPGKCFRRDISLRQNTL